MFQFKDIPPDVVAKALAYLRSKGHAISAEDFEVAFRIEPLPIAPAAARGIPAVIDAAQLDWRAHVGEHDRTVGGGIDRMFQVSGYSKYGVPKGDKKVPEWCGMACVSWLIRGGMNPGFNTSFLHCFNVEAFFTYGRLMNVNPARLDTQIQVAGSWQSIEDWHHANNARRAWMRLTAKTLPELLEDLGGDLFAAGDVLLIDWSLKRTQADHIALITGFDGRYLHTLEGNRTGKGPGGERWSDAVVACVYDLLDREDLLQVYGVGRLSRLDFEVHAVK